MTGPCREGTETGPESSIVIAAGGLILRSLSNRRWQVVVVHRPLRADWSFPKGKLEAGESLERAALREVREETGYWCRLGPFVGAVTYLDRNDRAKSVSYWQMRRTSGTFRVTDEVDELRWADERSASDLLTYQRDRDLLRHLDLD